MKDAQDTPSAELLLPREVGALDAARVLRSHERAHQARAVGDRTEVGAA